jgi:hypothetical protein
MTILMEMHPPSFFLSKIHYDMFSRSLDALSKTLRQDMYNLQDPGSTVKDVPDPDPLAS